MEIYGTEFAAGESVSGTIHSTPIPLAAKIADGQGRVTWQVPIDASFELGTHTVDLVGATSGAVVPARNTSEFTVLDTSTSTTTSTTTGTSTSTGTTSTSTSTGAGSGGKGSSLANTGFAFDSVVPVLSALLLAAGVATVMAGRWMSGTRRTSRR